MAKLKARRQFTHKGKTYNQGDHVEVSDHNEEQELIRQGHVEHADSGAQQGQAQGQGQQPPKPEEGKKS